MRYSDFKIATLLGVVGVAHTAQAQAAQTVTVRVWSPQTVFAPGERVQFTVAVQNTGRKPITLRFPTAQMFDLFVTPQRPFTPLTRSGPSLPVWQWSRDRMFTQANTSLTLAPGAKKRWYIGWDQKSNDGQKAAPGRYLAQVQLMSDKKLAAPFHFRLAGGVSAGSPLSSFRQPDARGTVKWLHPVSVRPIQKVLGSFGVEGKRGEAAHDKATVTVTRTTRFYRQTKQGKVLTSFDELREGDRVEVMFTGPVAESYPVQATADDVLVLSGK